MKLFSDGPADFTDRLDWVTGGGKPRERIIDGARIGPVRTVPAAGRKQADPRQAADSSPDAAPRPDPEAERQKAYREGLQQGTQAGYEDGLKRAYDEMRASMAALEAMRKSMESRRGSLIKDLDREITALAMEIAEKLMLNELEANPEAIVQVARKVIDRATERRGLKVRLNREDYEVLQERKKELMAGIVDLDEFTIVEDSTLGRGDCVVETSSGVIDARISARLNNVRSALGGKDGPVD